MSVSRRTAETHAGPRRVLREMQPEAVDAACGVREHDSGAALLGGEAGEGSEGSGAAVVPVHPAVVTGVDDEPAQSDPDSLGHLCPGLRTRVETLSERGGWRHAPRKRSRSSALERRLSAASMRSASGERGRPGHERPWSSRLARAAGTVTAVSAIASGLQAGRRHLPFWPVRPTRPTPSRSVPMPQHVLAIR